MPDRARPEASDRKVLRLCSTGAKLTPGGHLLSCWLFAEPTPHRVQAHSLECLVPRLLALAVLCLQLAACGSSSDSSRPPETPAPGPTPAPSDIFTASNGTRFGVQVLATGLEIPWAMAFAPDGRLFFTERPGRVRIFQNNQVLPEPALTLTGLHTDGESGLLGLALHPSFATNGFVYIVYDVEDPNGPFARLVRYRAVGNTLAEPAVLLDDVPAANIHNGSRVHFGPDGALYLSFGDAASPSVAQDLARLNGKVLRLNDDGTTPRDNPYSSPVWTWGHRNPQGFDWHPVTGEMYESEHGQTGNDEINVIARGANYGWPVIEGSATRPDMVTPITFFTPSVAPSGASFYRGTRVPGIPEQPVRGDTWRADAATDHAGRERSSQGGVDRSIDAGEIRTTAGGRERTGRVSLSLYEQSRRAEHARRV